MRLSKKGQYAVRAMVSLACHTNGAPVTLRDISDEEDISLSYLEQLFAKLRRGEVVRSIKGPGGGYVLTRPPGDITVGEVIEIVEEGLNPVACLDGDAAKCTRENRCATQRVWKGLGVRIRDFLNSISIGDLSGEAKELSRVIPRDN
ncbi:MAG: Rrf2 family transcriptional regulator [Deltaproteobacteria bacterium]|nr:Rrf2 family transcriptional regulator [Deltaproteobacteria bacterium]